MADKEFDKPEHHTAGARIKRGLSDFGTNWADNATLGRRVKGYLIPSVAMTTAMALGFTAALITDPDPTIDQGLKDRTTPLSQDFNANTQSSDLPPSVSIILHGQQVFGLIESNGHYNLYHVDTEDNQWVLVENPETASAFLTQVLGGIDVHLSQDNLQSLLKHSESFSYTQAYQLSGDTSVPYSIEKDNGGIDIVRFGDTTPMTLNLEEHIEYYKNAKPFWAKAQEAIAQGKYGINAEDLPQYTAEEFDFTDNVFDGYNASLALIYLSLFGGSTVLAAGQTIAQGRRRRKQGDLSRTPK